MEVHGGADINLQPVEDPTPEQVDVPEGGCDPMGSPRWSRFAGRISDPMLGSTTEQSVPEGLHPMERTHTGAVCEELQPVGGTKIGEVCGDVYPVGRTPHWSRMKKIRLYLKAYH
ncbi:ubx domain-containing protein 4 [Limosa lapponica baueri]|uniref:Ubx domain-containing protein 4 n=1 Tax=Limosa lapponica baueri TaxID=1758121 RepID=A0A2I0TWB7_LIMLA|nr:ubx domain-containing protein 4 [Limosa lapponica baueri]